MHAYNPLQFKVGDKKAELKAERKLSSKHYFCSHEPRNELGVPDGPYTSACGGCSTTKELATGTELLECTHCWMPSDRAKHFRPRQTRSAAAVCATGDWMHNIRGKLTCLQRGQTADAGESQLAAADHDRAVAGSCTVSPDPVADERVSKVRHPSGHTAFAIDFELTLKQY